MFKEARSPRPATTLVVLLLMLAFSAAGCGSGGGGGDSGGGVIQPPGLTASFLDSGTAAAANLVRTTGSSDGDLVVVGVIIGGPTISTDLYSFAFDLTLGDATVAEYVAGSASVGTALTASGSQTLHVLATQQGNRVTVGVTKLGGGSGNGLTQSGEFAVVELTFRLLQPGTTTLTIEGSPGADPSALDSTGGIIASVSFDAASATLIGT
jgi:hypothetical protein